MSFHERNIRQFCRLLILFSRKNATLDFLSVVSNGRIGGLCRSFSGLLPIEDRLGLSSGRSLVRSGSILNHMLITAFCQFLS